jgi:Pyridine nucleotide-disulphide oxidoreductase
MRSFFSRLLLAGALDAARRGFYFPAAVLTGAGGVSVYAAFAADDADDSSPLRVREKYTYVICGAGPAGLHALKTLQAHADPTHSILVVAPTIRTGIIDQLLDSSSSSENCVADLHQNPQTDIMLGNRIVAIDPVHRTATLESGEGVGFQKLLLAVGGDVTPKNLRHVAAAEAEGMVGFIQSPESIVELENLLTRSKDAEEKPTAHVTVIGGSWAAACAGASLVEKGVAVTLSFAEPALLARHFPRYISDELVKRFMWASKNNFDSLSYSVLHYVTREDDPSSLQGSVTALKQEADVHMSLVFDPYSIFNFRTDFVVFAPTMLPASHLVPSVLRDAGGRLVCNPELAIYSDIFAAGSCLSSVHAGGLLNLGYWSSERAAATGRHAAWSMLGRREPLEIGHSRFCVNLDPLALKLYCAGIQDGNAETYGCFMRSREHSDATSGGHLASGVICFVQPVPRQSGRVRVVGLAVWDGSRNCPMEEAHVLGATESFLLSPLYESRQALEASVMELCHRLLHRDADDAGDVGPLVRKNRSPDNDRRLYLRRHTQPRKVRIGEEEVLWFDAEHVLSDSDDKVKINRSVAFDALLRRPIPTK